MGYGCRMGDVDGWLIWMGLVMLFVDWGGVGGFGWGKGCGWALKDMAYF